MKKLILLISTFVVSLAIFSQLDDELSKDAKRYLEALEGPKESEAYTYLLGIYAAENDNPENLGKSLLQEYKLAERDPFHEISDYPESDKLPRPEGELFCQFSEKGCVERLFRGAAMLDVDKPTTAALTSRAKKFYSFNEYTTLTKPTLGEVMPPYHYLVTAARVEVISAIQQHQNGNTKFAIEILQKQLAELRNALGNQDHLVGKMVMVAKLSDVIDVLGIIASTEELDLDPIKKLSPAEKDISKIVAREVGLSYHLFSNLADNPELFRSTNVSPSVGSSGKLPKWIVRIFFKPNMTINVDTLRYLRLEQLSQLTAEQFAIEIENHSEQLYSSSKIRNSVGNILLSIQGPEHEKYIARIFDLDAKIDLVNRVNLGFETFNNPYYKKLKPKRSPNKVCFRGPLEDELGIRCLRTGLSATP